ncbi:MAG: hypothetical protein GXY44_05375 [Phycisphaerales bacterium]|nr:hypothetical protein [Phycisphaerales bacterium]
MRRRLANGWRPLWPGVLVALTASSGCIQNTVPAEKFQNVQRELQACQERSPRLEEQIAAQQKTIENLQSRIAELRGMSPDALREMVYPEKIELTRWSGAYNEDERTGDDGLLLYIQPIDRDGHVIKAAGELNITLLDLADPTAPAVIASYKFEASKTRSFWHGRLMTLHYTVRCPWPPGYEPRHDQITAQVSFTDLLTGAVLTTQRTFPITLAPKLDQTDNR